MKQAEHMVGKMMSRVAACFLAIGLLLPAVSAGQTSNVGFNPNGGTLSGGNFGAKNGTTQTATLTLTYGKSAYNAGMRATRTAGYAFNGFWTAATGGSQIYDANGKYVPNCRCWDANGKWKHTGNAMLYAQWHTHTVKFNPNGGVLRGGNFGAKEYTSQTASLQMACGSGAYNTGMRAEIKSGPFYGWWTAKSGGTQIYDENGKYVAGSRCWTADGKWRLHANAELFARWDAPKTHTVTFSTENGGALYGVNFGSDSGSMSGSEITVAMGKGAYNSGMRAVRVGFYKFKGWYTAFTGGKRVYNADGRFVPGTFWTDVGTWQYDGDVTVYAQWAKDDSTYRTWYEVFEWAVDDDWVAANLTEEDLDLNGFKFSGFKSSAPWLIFTDNLDLEPLNEKVTTLKVHFAAKENTSTTPRVASITGNLNGQKRIEIYFTQHGADPE